MFKLNDYEIDLEQIKNSFSLESFIDPETQVADSISETNVYNDQYFKDMTDLAKIKSVIEVEGIDSGTASIVAEIIPNFDSDYKPLCSYTNEPSPVNLAYALESIDSFVKIAFDLNKYKLQ